MDFCNVNSFFQIVSGWRAVKIVCFPVIQDVNIAQNFCCEVFQNFWEPSTCVESLSCPDARTELFSARFCSPGGDCRTVMVCSTQTCTVTPHSPDDLKNSNQLLIIYLNKSVHNLFPLLWGCMRLLLLLAHLDSRWPQMELKSCFKLLLTFLTFLINSPPPKV